MCIGYIQEQSEKELNKIVNAGIKEGRSTAQQDNDCTQLRFLEKIQKTTTESDYF